MRVFDANLAALYAPDAPGGIAQQENIAGHALDRKILGHAPQVRAVRVRNDIVIRIVRNGSTASERR